MRDLGAVLDREEPPPIRRVIKRSSDYIWVMSAFGGNTDIRFQGRHVGFDPGCVKTLCCCYDSPRDFVGELMRRFVEEADRGQWTLLPECLDDFIDESNPVRVIDVFVDALDLAEMRFEGVEPAATGRPSYHPSVLLKLYIYGYLNRVQSSRRLEREADAISGPRSSAAIKSASVAACHSGLCCFALGSAMIGTPRLLMLLVLCPSAGRLDGRRGGPNQPCCSHDGPTTASGCTSSTDGADP
jgi:hypothetical protein